MSYERMESPYRHDHPQVEEGSSYRRSTFPTNTGSTNTPLGPEGCFKTDTAYLSAVTPCILTTTPQHFPSCHFLFFFFLAFFRIFLSPPSFVFPSFPFPPSLSPARGKSQLVEVPLLFFRDAINDARFPFGWPSGEKKRVGLSSLFLRGVFFFLDGPTVRSERRLVRRKFKRRREFRTSLSLYSPRARERLVLQESKIFIALVDLIFSNLMYFFYTFLYF